MSTEWVERQSHETDLDYISRVSSQPNDFGLVAGRLQLGRRMKRSPEVRLHHTWVLDNVPAKWTTSQTLALLQATFENVELLHQNRRKGQTFAYVFKGAAERNSDIIALLVETDEAGQTTLWARWAEPRAKAPTQSRTEGGWSLRPPAQQWPTEAATIAVQSGDAAGAAEAMPVDNDEAKKKKKVSFAEPPPNSKKAKAEQRAIPAGLKLVPMEPDGNCLFSSAAHVIKLTLKKNVSALELEAEVVGHMRKHEQRYATPQYPIHGLATFVDFNAALSTVATPSRQKFSAGDPPHWPFSLARGLAPLRGRALR